MATKPLKEIQLPGLKYTYTVDADTVDGKHAADFAEAAHEHANYLTNAFKEEISKAIVSEQTEFIVADEDGNKVFEVDAQGTTNVKAITVDGVDVLGDISTALDSILTQTATIIGGNS